MSDTIQTRYHTAILEQRAAAWARAIRTGTRAAWFEHNRLNTLVSESQNLLRR